MARLIALVIFGGGGIAMFYVGITQYLAQRELMQNAEPVRAEIVLSRVVAGTSADTDRRVGPTRDTSTTSYTPEVRFRYEIDGGTYESDLLHPNIIVRGYVSADGAAGDLKPYPLGSVVTAWVDRRHPERGFLIPEEGAGPLVFMIVGLVLPPLAWFVGRFL